MKKINKKLLLLIASILILIGIFRFSESTADFSTYNPDWNGGVQTREFLSENHQVIVMPVRSDLASFGPNETAFIILGPSGNFSENDIYTIRKFVESGGLLVLGDDFGSGNELLNNLTTSVSFSNMLLQDDVNFWKNSTFPVAATSIVNVSNITMNYATSLVITGTSIKVLAITSSFGRISKNESERGQQGSYPVIAHFSYGKGEIVAVADPSIFINSMLPMEENNLLLEELVGNRTTVIFDEMGRMPPLSNFDYLIKTNPNIQYPFAGIVISLAFLYVKRDKISLFKRRKTDNHAYGELNEKYIISDILKRNKWSERKLMLFKNRLKKVKEGK
jgi:hypothetical protein